MTITRIGRDHIIISDDDINDDDYESRRRSRILPYNTLTVNKVNNKSNNYCPQCKRGTTGGKLVNLLYDKELSAFICPVCSYVRYVNPTNRNEMSPGYTTTEPRIPTLDGLTDQQALQRESGGAGRKPIIRSIGDPRLRSQYSSSSSNLRFGDGGGGGIQADAETRAWAHNHNASIVAYSEKVLQDSNNVVSSKELKWRDKLQ
jgi:hypothetical protein